jgi:hypothetical protein
MVEGEKSETLGLGRVIFKCDNKLLRLFINELRLIKI